MNAFLFMIDNLISKQHPLRYCWQVARWAGYGVWGTMKLTMKWRRGSLYIFSVTNSRANVCPKMLVWGCSSCTWHGKNKSFSHNFGKFWNEWKNTMMVLMICDLGTNVCDLRAGEAMVDTWRIARLLVGKKIPNRVLQTKFCVRTFTNPSSFLSFSSLIWILCHHRIQWKHHQMKWNVLILKHALWCGPAKVEALMSPLADLEISNKPVRSVILGFYSLRFVLLLRVALQAASKFEILAMVSGNETPQDYCTALWKQWNLIDVPFARFPMVLVHQVLIRHVRNTYRVKKGWYNMMRVWG